MDPQDSCLATARGDRDIGHEMARGEADTQKAECTTPSVERSIAPRLSSRGYVDDAQGRGTLRGMARPTRVQILQIAIMSVVVFVGVNVLVGLLVFAFTVATGMWTDRY
jgi:hypothetical protein